MKIVSVRAIAHRGLEKDMRGDSRNYVYARVETDDGLVGWGEASCGSLAVVPMVEELGNILIGLDPSQIERHWQAMYHFHHALRGGVIHLAGISAIDMALWDIKGKRLGVPVYDLLGGAMRDRLWCYGRYDASTPEQAAERAKREVLRGLTALKADPFRQKGSLLGAEGMDLAVNTVMAVREAVGPNVEILVEAHGRLTVPSALQFLDRVKDARIFFLEEPIAPDNLDGLERIVGQTPVQIALGERLFGKWAFRPVLERQLADIIQPDPAHTGGITECKKIAAMAEAYNFWVQFHNPFGPINTLVSAHLSMAIPNFLMMELILDEKAHAWFHQVTLTDFPKIEDGHFTPPNAPGIGIELDEKLLVEYPPVNEKHPMGYVRQSPIASRQMIDWT